MDKLEIISKVEKSEWKRRNDELTIWDSEENRKKYSQNMEEWEQKRKDIEEKYYNSIKSFNKIRHECINHKMNMYMIKNSIK
tara:strand:- start:1209 stop:1454 length:246 start_codon:yes stop_codon:yes gene_type:complete